MVFIDAFNSKNKKPKNHLYIDCKFTIILNIKWTNFFVSKMLEAEKEEAAMLIFTYRRLKNGWQGGGRRAAKFFCYKGRLLRDLLVLRNLRFGCK